MGRPDPDEFLLAVKPALESGDADSLARQVARWSPAALSTLLSHADRDVRRTAVVVLGIVGDGSVVGCLTRCLHDPDDRVHQFAEDALWSIWFRAGNDVAAPPFHEALAALAEDRHADAVSCLHEALHHDPDFAEAYNQLAIAEYLQGHWSRSVDACREALARLPTHFGAMAGLGHGYAHVGELRQAVDCYRRALAINPRMHAIATAKSRLERQLARHQAADPEGSGDAGGSEGSKDSGGPGGSGGSGGEAGHPATNLLSFNADRPCRE